MAPNPRDIAFVPGGIPAFQPVGPGGQPSGLLQGYQVQPFTLTGGLLANGTIVTGNLDPALLQHYFGTYTSAQMATVAAPGGLPVPGAVAVVGKAYNVFQASMSLVPGNVAFTSGNVVALNEGSVLIGNIAASIITGNVIAGQAFGNGGNFVMTANAALNFSAAANFAGGGTSTVRYDVWAALVPLT